MWEVFFFFTFLMVNSFFYMMFFGKEENRIRKINGSNEYSPSIEFVLSFHCFMTSFFVVSSMILFFIAYGLVNIKFPPNFFM